MAITEAAERLALYKIIDYLDEDPAEHIEKIMGLVNKFTPDDVFPTQRAAFSHAIEAKTNWYELMMKVFDLNPLMRSRLLKTLIADANILAWPKQEKMREKYRCNIPWAILLDPTSACNLRCTGCWAAEYGHALNLTLDDIDSIIEQGKKARLPHLYLHRWRAAGTQGRRHPSVRKAPGLRVSVLHQRHAHR